MNLHTKILSVDAVTGTAVVRFFTDLITESDLASQVDTETGEILRCTTDYNCWLPREPLQGNALIAYFKKHAPVEMFDRMEKARAGQGIDTSGAEALVNQTVQGLPTEPVVVNTTPTLAQAKADKLAAIKLQRQSKEHGGILVGPVSVATDPESQAKIGNALAAMQNGFLSTVDWKGENGWVNLEIDDITALAHAVAVHVQGCYTWEKQLAAQVNAATTIAQVEAIDINSDTIVV